MNAQEYSEALQTLNWTQRHFADAFGVDRRTAYRYAAGDTDIPGPAARLLRLLVMLRLTLSEEKFKDVLLAVLSTE